jgi:hypothetical protein
MSLFLGNLDMVKNGSSIDDRYGITIYSQDKVKLPNGKKEEKFSSFVSGTLLMDGLSLKGGNNYDSWAGMLGDVISMSKGVSSVASALGRGAKAFESVAGAAGAGIGTTPKQLTRQIWTGSDNPVFFIQLMFICLDSADPNQSVVKKINSIMRYLYPELALNKKQFGFSGILTAPAGYNPVLKKGLARLQIGRWFNAPNLIIQNANFETSKELNRAGEPIYATGQIMMSPFEAISYEEYLAYFTGGRYDV